MTPPDIVARALTGKRFPLEDEKRCQSTIEEALSIFADMRREVKCTGGVIDFVVGRTGVEVKLKGAKEAIRRQIRRYAKDDQLDAIILLTAKPVGMESEIDDKPIVEIRMGMSWL